MHISARCVIQSIDRLKPVSCQEMESAIPSVVPSPVVGAVTVFCARVTTPPSGMPSSFHFFIPAEPGSRPMLLPLEIHSNLCSPFCGWGAFERKVKGMSSRLCTTAEAAALRHVGAVGPKTNSINCATFPAVVAAMSRCSVPTFLVNQVSEAASGRGANVQPIYSRLGLQRQFLSPRPLSTQASSPAHPRSMGMPLIANMPLPPPAVAGACPGSSLGAEASLGANLPPIALHAPQYGSAYLLAALPSSTSTIQRINLIGGTPVSGWNPPRPWRASTTVGLAPTVGALAAAGGSYSPAAITTSGSAPPHSRLPSVQGALPNLQICGQSAGGKICNPYFLNLQCLA